MFILFFITNNNFIISCESKDYLGLLLFGVSVEIVIKSQSLRTMHEKNKKLVDVTTSTDDKSDQHLILPTIKALQACDASTSLQAFLPVSNNISVQELMVDVFNNTFQSHDCFESEDKTETQSVEKSTWSDIYEDIG